MTSVSAADKRISEDLQRLAALLEGQLELIAGEPVAFCLVVFQTEDDSATSYVSNADREEIKDGLEQLLEHWKTNELDIPAHELHKKLN